MRQDLARESRRILKDHPYAGARIADLQQVLEQCTPRDLDAEGVLCREGESGEEAFFLLRGSVRVMKEGPGGKDQELAQIQAPALLGHMSLVDNSRRSATCVAASPCQFLVLDGGVYGTMLSEASARATALRRLLLSSLTRQLISGNLRLQSLLVESGEAVASPPLSGPRHEEERSDRDDITEDDLLKTAGVLDGWQVDLHDLDDLGAVKTKGMVRRGAPKKRW